MARTKSKISSDFIVRFAGVDLPREARERIAEAIQVAALKEFTKLDLATQLVPQIPPAKLWAGIHLRVKDAALGAKLQLPTLEVTEKPRA